MSQENFFLLFVPLNEASDSHFFANSYLHIFHFHHFLLRLLTFLHFLFFLLFATVWLNLSFSSFSFLHVPISISIIQRRFKKRKYFSPNFLSKKKRWQAHQSVGKVSNQAEKRSLKFILLLDSPEYNWVVVSYTHTYVSIKCSICRKAFFSFTNNV
jgi:hypothetical protein